MNWLWLLVDRIASAFVSERGLTNEKIRSYGRCPVCGKSMESHKIWKMGGVVHGSAQEERLDESVNRREWKAAAEPVELQWEKDLVFYQVLYCPIRSKYVVQKVVSYYEMYFDDEVVATIDLDSRDIASILELAGKQWLTLNLG